MIMIASNHQVPWMVDNVDATEPEWEATSEESSNAPCSRNMTCERKSKLLAERKNVSIIAT